jgi:hypothetical protein
MTIVPSFVAAIGFSVSTCLLGWTGALDFSFSLCFPP